MVTSAPPPPFPLPKPPHFLRPLPPPPHPLIVQEDVRIVCQRYGTVQWISPIEENHDHRYCLVVMHQAEAAQRVICSLNFDVRQLKRLETRRIVCRRYHDFESIVPSKRGILLSARVQSVLHAASQMASILQVGAGCFPCRGGCGARGMACKGVGCGVGCVCMWWWMAGRGMYCVVCVE